MPENSSYRWFFFKPTIIDIRSVFAVRFLKYQLIPCFFDFCWRVYYFFFFSTYRKWFRFFRARALTSVEWTFKRRRRSSVNMRNRNGAPCKLQLYGRPAAASQGRRVDVGRTRGARAMALAAIADDNAADAHMKRALPSRVRAHAHTRSPEGIRYYFHATPTTRRPYDWRVARAVFLLIPVVGTRVWAACRSIGDGERREKLPDRSGLVYFRGRKPSKNIAPPLIMITVRNELKA